MERTIYYRPSYKERLEEWSYRKEPNGYGCSSCNLKNPKHTAPAYGDEDECFRCFMKNTTYLKYEDEDYVLKDGEWEED